MAGHYSSVKYGSSYWSSDFGLTGFLTTARFYGARPLKRFIQHHFETQLARSLISGEITDGSTVRAGMNNGKLVSQCL